MNCRSPYNDTYMQTQIILKQTMLVQINGPAKYTELWGKQIKFNKVSNGLDRLLMIV